MDLQRLFDEFPPEVIHWRLGALTAKKDRGMALAYIDARDVMDRLDAVCEPHNWQCEYVDAGNGKMACRIGILVGDHWVWKADGAGETDVEGVKGAFSDAFKRAAVKWGIGRYLYDIDSPWVEIEPQGRSHRIKAHEYGRLSQLLGGKPSHIVDIEDVSISFETMEVAIKNAETLKRLEHVWKLNYPLLRDWSDSGLKQITKIKDERKAILMDVEAAS